MEKQTCKTTLAITLIPLIAPVDTKTEKPMRDIDYLVLAITAINWSAIFYLNDVPLMAALLLGCILPFFGSLLWDALGLVRL